MVSAKRMMLLFLLYWCMVPVIRAESQPRTLQESETQLKRMFDRVNSRLTDQEKAIAADSIANIFQETLNLTGSFDYPFSLLNALGKITSRDQRLRIYTWNIPASDGTNKYYGFLQVKTNPQNETRVFRLNDIRASLTDPAMTTLTDGNWYGCLIYEIIEKKLAGTTSYTLLGYNPENRFVSRKIIDLLWFNEANEPVLGKPIFQYQKRTQCRILFEYSAKVTMSLQWNDKMDMIVHDHLSPSKPSYSGNYQYYGPDFSFDGFKFEKGMWVAVENLDVRNSKE